MTTGVFHPGGDIRGGCLTARIPAGSLLGSGRYVRIYQGGRPGRAGDGVLGPLPQALQRFGVAERDGSLQARAGLHPGQIHDRIDQAGPAARGVCPDEGCSDVRTVPSACSTAVTPAAATVWSPSLTSA